LERLVFERLGDGKMNINNFEEYIDGVILSRGHGYYSNGNIISLEYDEGEWIAEVEGSDDYTVTVHLSEDGEILHTSCDCPYDWDEYCKHQAAVFYAIRDQEKPPVKTSAKESLEAVLNKLDKQTLISVVLEIASRDKRIKEVLRMRFSEKTDITKYARDVIQSAIIAVSNRGYVEYPDALHAINGANEVLAMIDEKISAGEILSAVELCVVTLEETMELLDNCDDSGGHVGGVIGEAIEKIGLATSDMKSIAEDAEKLFNMIFSHAQNKIYDGWTDWRMDILTALVPLCGHTANREKLEGYLLSRQLSAMKDRVRDYELRELQGLQLRVIERFDDKAAADSYVERHVDNPDFRRAAIETAMSKKQYDRALALCLDGEEKDARLVGLARDWKEWRYRIYEKTKDVAAQKELARELLINGEFDYLLKLKSLYSDAEWPQIVQDILANFGVGNQSGVYVQILLHEKLKPQLLEYCKKNVITITKYYTHLIPEFKAEVGKIFTEYIRGSAALANGRNQYRDICGVVKHYEQACGKDADAIKDELRLRYAKRPAFLDELRKL
jgi:hypothetical protein